VEKARLTLHSHLKPSLDGQQDFTFEDKLKIEAMILGFCAGASPLDYFKNELKSFKIIPSSLFSKIVNAAGPAFSGNIFTAGTIINRRIEKTRDGKSMLFCTIEDKGGMFESVFFPGPYLENLNILMNRTVLIIAGRLHHKDGDITLIGSKAIDLFHLKRISSDFKKENLKQGILAEAGPTW